MKNSFGIHRATKWSGAFCLLAAGALVPVGALGDVVSARPAYDFVNAAGIVTHFNYPNSPYVTQYQQVKNALSELGIRHIRDNAGSTQGNTSYKDLWLTLGVRLLATIDYRSGPTGAQRLDPTGINKELQDIKQQTGVAAITAFEGPNEPNLEGDRNNNDNWAEDTRIYQQRLMRAVRTDSALAAIPVVGPSIAYPETKQDDLGDMTGLSDQGNGHIYGNYWSFSQKMSSVMPKLRLSWPYQPIVVTEFGWQRAYNSGKQYIDEDVYVKYVTRGMATVVARPDVRRGFIYQLVDDIYDPNFTDGAAHHGLIDFNLQKKPGFYSVRNIMRILCDNAMTSSAGSLGFTLSGSLGYVKQLLFRKNNGAFYLLLWQERPSYLSGGKVVIPPEPVSVAFADPLSLVRMYQPSNPSGNLTTAYLPLQTWTAPSNLTVDVPDHIVVLEIVPQGVAQPPLPSTCTFQAT